MKKKVPNILWIILLIVLLLLLIKITTCVTREIREAEVKVPIVVSQPISPKTQILERNIKSGNKGYFIFEKEYVYFGINKTIREELLVK